LQDVFKEEEGNFQHLNLEPWTAEEAGQYLTSKEYTFGLAEELVKMTSGRPGFLAELADLIADDEDLRGKMGGDLTDLFNLIPDADELDSEEDSDAGENARKKATAEDAGKVAFISSLLGMSFPSGIVADMLNLDRSSVDDIYDATETAYKEVQF